MLHYNIRNVIKFRGIEKPFAFLVSAGLSPGMATRIINKPQTIISPRKLELLCYALHCTPNDLMTWTPDQHHVTPDDHPIRTVGRTIKAKNMLGHIRNLPFDQLNKVERFIKDMAIQEKEQNKTQ